MFTFIEPAVSGTSTHTDYEPQDLPDADYSMRLRSFAPSSQWADTGDNNPSDSKSWLEQASFTISAGTMYSVSIVAEYGMTGALAVLLAARMPWAVVSTTIFHLSMVSVI